MNIIEIIKKRKSCRNFNRTLLNPDNKKELENFINENGQGFSKNIINIKIVEKNSDDKRMKLDYGLIRGHRNYLLGKSKSDITSRVEYGYIVEKVVLKATEMNLSTCWVGYFDDSYFDEVKFESGFEIPSIIVIGYQEKRATFLDKFVGFSAKSTTRLNWDTMFFNHKSKTAIDRSAIGKYSDSLEMVRLAPSSGNTQPWRIFFDGIANEFHFYKKPVSKRYESKGLHDVDMGIALSHFELTSLYNNLSGSWIKHPYEKVSSIDDLQYIMTWKSK
jgi:nitroreductase